MYCQLADMRAEGLVAAMADDARLLAACEHATALIDHACGWFFEPRPQAVTVRARGGRCVDLPLHPIALSSAWMDGAEMDVAALTLCGAPVTSHTQTQTPQATLRTGMFARDARVELRGTFGYTVAAAGRAEGITPPAIRHAAVLLAARLAMPLFDDIGYDLRVRGRVVEERTRDQSFRLAPMTVEGLTGDAEVDAILASYRRPVGLGCA